MKKKRVVVFQTLESKCLLNAAPIAGDDLYLVTADQIATFGTMLLNDSDADGEPLRIVSFTQPEHGILRELDASSFEYVPDADFAGRDVFRYSIADPSGATSSAEVVIAINREIDVSEARDAILDGVQSIGNPVQPGKMVAFGPQATSLAYYADGIEHGPLSVAAGWGEGRVIAMPDHQWLNMEQQGPQNDTARFYDNAIGWLAESSSKDIKVVTYNSTSNQSYLQSAGYANVVNASRTSTLVDELADADVFVAGWLGSNPSSRVLDATADYVRGGGALFVADYGPGYDWWWNKDLPDAPGNRLLREAGISFGTDIIWDGDPVSTSNIARGRVDASVVIDVLRDSSGHSSRVVEEAGYNLSQLYRTLPEGDSLLAELDLLFAERISDIHPSPSNEISDPFEQALLTREMSLLEQLPVDEVTAHRTAEAVYGEIPESAERVTGTYTVDASTSLWQSTGFYAAPGDTVRINVPRNVIGKGYEIRINGHRDNISRRDDWDRVPFGVSRTFAIESETIEVANAFGGSIYIDVGDTPPSQQGVADFDVTIENALRQPHFVLGETTNEQWESIREAPAPYAEFVSDHVAFSVPSAWIRALADPEALMQFWDETGARQDYVGALETFRTAPERFNVDVQISVGLLHAGYPIQGPTWASEKIVDLSELRRAGSWGYFHELGHQMQARPDREGNFYTFPGDGEVTVNIFANASLEHSVVNPPTSGWGYSAYPHLVMQRAMETVADSTKPSFDDKDAYPFYFQLSDAFGFETYRDVFQTYHDDFESNPDALPDSGTERKDEFYVRWSEVSGHDMTRYMVDLWGLEVSAGAKRRVAGMNLPDFLPAFADAPATLVVAKNASAKLELAAKTLSYDDQATITNVTAGAHGAIEPNDDGSWTYLPNVGYEGPDVVRFDVVSSTGFAVTQSVNIDVKLSGVLLETYTDIGGTSVRNLTRSSDYPDSPTQVSRLTSFEAPTNRDSDFGARARGWLTAPATGNYRFWIASDDNGELHLSTDAAPENTRIVANVPGWTAPRQWTKYTQQRSELIRLTEGQRYYIEAIMKEGGGGDNLAIAWDGPGFSQEVIPEYALEIYYEGNARPETQDDIVTVTGRTIVDVLANDTDRDGDTLLLTSVVQPPNGTARITADSKIEYLPSDLFVGTEEFEYQVSDGMGGLSTGTVQVTASATSAPVTGFVQSDNKIVIQGDAVELIGLEFKSAAGLLIPAENAEPFSVLLSNTSEWIAVGNLGSTVRLEGELTTNIRYTGDDPATDLTASFGNDSGVQVDFVVERRSSPSFDCNGDGSTDIRDVDCACEAGNVDEILSHLGLIAGDLDADGRVAFADFLVLSRNFGASEATYTQGDLDCSGGVSFADFLVLSQNFGRELNAT